MKVDVNEEFPRSFIEIELPTSYSLFSDDKLYYTDESYKGSLKKSDENPATGATTGSSHDCYLYKSAGGIDVTDR